MRPAGWTGRWRSWPPTWGWPRQACSGRFFTGWADLVGDQVAAHATPVSLRGGVLVVVVDQPAWATQLRFLSADVRRRLAEVAGDDAVREVQIRVRDDRSGRRRQGAGNRRPDTPT